jgi:hypothetical protein
VTDQPLPASRKSFEVFLSIFVKTIFPEWCSDDCKPEHLEAMASAKGYEIGILDEAPWPYERCLYLKVLDRFNRLRVEAFEEDRPEPRIDGRLIREVCTGTEPPVHDYGPYLDDWVGPESSDDGQSSVESSEDEGSTMLTGSVGTGSGSTTSGLRRMMSRRTGRLGEQSQGSQSSDGDTSD